ncbi:MAG TPA: hypothetical protein VEJ41_01685 [Candidatus Acidoferrales bacterium]|nr:hypothetical protein [Candidatus Acidoferrales bacterium]
MAAELQAACAQFEELMLGSLLPTSLFAFGSQSSDVTSALGGLDREIFKEAFAAAFERAGGLGLAPELDRDLERPS